MKTPVEIMLRIKSLSDNPTTYRIDTLHGELEALKVIEMFGFQDAELKHFRDVINAYIWAAEKGREEMDEISIKRQLGMAKAIEWFLYNDSS